MAETIDIFSQIKKIVDDEIAKLLVADVIYDIDYPHIDQLIRCARRTSILFYILTNL